MAVEAHRHRPRLPRAREAPRRRLATVLFVDIVDSTGLATTIGDRRWRELLVRFRRTVREQLRRHSGVEQDTAGDGFFATLTEPDEAVRAAVDIVRASQDMGVEVRAGIHTGECDLIDGHLGGVAA